MHSIDVAERRARLARRHRLAPGHRAADVVEAAGSVVGLHGTDPGTIALSAWARVDGLTVADVERALYVDRSVVKHLAMRRTLFVLPRATLASAQAGASDRVAAAERRRLVRDVEAAGLHADGERWLAEATAAVLAALAGGRQATMAQLRLEVPALDGSIVQGAGRWGGPAPVGPRVLTAVSAAGHLVRGTNDGPWTVSRPRWASMHAWLGHELERPPEREGLARLVELWLRAFGPGTAADLKWWLGSTVAAVRQALADVRAVEVGLDGAGPDGAGPDGVGRDEVTGYVLPDDVGPTEALPPWAALLPGLDPTTMGWFERDWYLGAHRSVLFDTNGNAGPTAWWDGRVVGGWRQRAGGEVVLQLLEDVGAEAQAALSAEAERLQAWLAGTRVLPRFPSPLSRGG